MRSVTLPNGQIEIHTASVKPGEFPEVQNLAESMQWVHKRIAHEL